MKQIVETIHVKNSTNIVYKYLWLRKPGFNKNNVLTLKMYYEGGA